MIKLKSFLVQPDSNGSFWKELFFKIFLHPVLWIVLCIVWLITFFVWYPSQVSKPTETISQISQDTLIFYQEENARLKHEKNEISRQRDLAINANKSLLEVIQSINSQLSGQYQDSIGVYK